MPTAILAADATQIIADQTKVNQMVQAAMSGAWELLFSGADGESPDFLAMVVRPALGIAVIALAFGIVKLFKEIAEDWSKFVLLVPLFALCVLLAADGFLFRWAYLGTKQIIYNIDERFAETIGGEAQAWFEKEKQAADDSILKKVQQATAKCDSLPKETDEQEKNQKVCYENVSDFIKDNIGSVNSESIKAQIEILQDAIDDRIGGNGISFGDLSGLLTGVTETFESIIRWILRALLVVFGFAIAILIDLSLLVTGIIAPLFIAPAFFDRSFIAIWLSGLWALAIAKWSLRIMVGVVQIYSTKAQLGVGIVDSAYPFLGEILLGICAPIFAAVAAAGGGMAGLQITGGAIGGANRFMSFRGGGGGSRGTSNGSNSSGGGRNRNRTPPKPSLVDRAKNLVTTFKRPKSR